MTEEGPQEERRAPARRSDVLPDLSGSRPETMGQLAEYRLQEKLGQGGMGVVYRARHTALDREVAIKILPPGQLHDQQALSRFKREIKAVGQLEHPNIVRAYDARECDGVHFLVMELVAGLDLAELVRRLGPLPVADACEAVRQTADGLECARSAGLVHRDIKPSNLIVSDDGVVKILDLGLVRASQTQSSDVSMTVSGQALGTPDYMAPEQVQDSRDVDIRADLYSLGCTLFFLLTGRAPFGGRNYQSAFDKMSAHVHQPAPHVAEMCPDVPDALSQLVDKLLAKEPQNRVSSPLELSEQLQPFCHGSDLRAAVAQAEGRTATPRPRADLTGRPPARINPRGARPIWVAVAGIALIASVAFAVLWSRHSIDHTVTEEVPAGTPAIPVDGGVQEPKLAGWIVVSWTLPGTGKPDLWLFAADGQQRIQLTNDPQRFDNNPCFSPDGRRIAFIRGIRFDQPTSLWVCNSDGSQLREIATPSGNTERYMSPVWLSNSAVCYTRDPVLDRLPDMEVWEVNVDEPEPQRMFRFADVLEGSNGVVTDASANGQELAIVAQTNWAWPTSNVYITDVAGKLIQSVWRDLPDDRKDARALWSVEGDQLAWHHNFTRGALGDSYYYGVGWAERTADGGWDAELQSSRELRITPLAWEPLGTRLLCAQMSSDETAATLVLMNRQFRIVRELFPLETHGWQPGQRDFGRLADWAIIPADLPLQDRE